MKTCPQCYKGDNPDDVTACVQCGFAFDRTADLFHRPCPSGKHQMDPTWSECAFCKAEGVGSESFARKETVSESAPSAGSAKPEVGSPGRHGTAFDAAAAGAGSAQRGAPATARPQPASRETRLDPHADDLYVRPGPVANAGSGRSVAPHGGEQSNGRKTSFGSLPGSAAIAAGDKRRIVGVLITYTWKPEGQVFEVREGRNRIGRDPGQCDIVIEQDDTLSAENSSIAYRTKFVISDKDSMSGTYVDDVPVEEASFPLQNYAKIRAGSTTFTFIAVDPTKAAV